MPPPPLRDGLPGRSARHSSTPKWGLLSAGRRAAGRRPPWSTVASAGNPARYITFPAFDIETMEISPAGDVMYDTMDDW